MGIIKKLQFIILQVLLRASLGEAREVVRIEAAGGEEREEQLEEGGLVPEDVAELAGDEAAVGVRLPLARDDDFEEVLQIVAILNKHIS